MILKSQLDLHVNHCDNVSHLFKLWLAVMDRADCLREIVFLEWFLGLGSYILKNWRTGSTVQEQVVFELSSQPLSPVGNYAHYSHAHTLIETHTHRNKNKRSKNKQN